MESDTVELGSAQGIELEELRVVEQNENKDIPVLSYLDIFIN